MLQLHTQFISTEQLVLLLPLTIGKNVLHTTRLLVGAHERRSEQQVLKQWHWDHCSQIEDAHLCRGLLAKDKDCAQQSLDSVRTQLHYALCIEAKRHDCRAPKVHVSRQSASRYQDPLYIRQIMDTRDALWPARGREHREKE